MYAFIITSAINTKFGTFDPDTRMTQTLETIQSIKDRVPNSDIFLVEMCAVPLTPEQQKTLLAEVTEITSYADFPDVKVIYEITSQDIVKSMTEMLCFNSFIPTKDWSKYKRVFKISGRYHLNDNFKIEEYEHNHSITFSGIYNSQFDPKITGNPPDQNYQFMSRLWSLPSDMVDKVIYAYPRMLNNMVNQVNVGGYIDIEHLLYKHIPRECVVIKKPVGLTGGIAPNGMIVND